jgi:hypothetical protein
MTLVAGSGSAQLAALAVRLKAQGDKTIRPRLLQGLKAGAKPCIVAVKASGLDKLPHKGGLNKTVTDPPITVSVRTGARTAGVRLVTKAHGAEPTNDGWVRHPVFARKTKVANGTTKGGKAKTKAFYVSIHGGGYAGDLGYGGSVKAEWVEQQIPNAKGWWSETLANSGPLVEPELKAVMNIIADEIQGGI